LALAGAACAHLLYPSNVATEPLLEDLGDHRHAISTDTALAQRYFDQGLTLSFGFNHAASVRAFKEAARLDSDCAMCFWGIALALGPNINTPMGPEAAREAHAAIRRAQELASGATQAERAYIDALATRYSNEPLEDRTPLDRAYATAMRQLHQRYPDDVDAATLFAEALMDLNPWNHWSPEGEPAEDTPEIVRTLESVLERDPGHPGANHYYIHAVEASPNPERAVPAADRLGAAVPGAGHLVHMPSHIYIRVGRYNDALEINRRAAAADEEYFAWCRSRGIYRALYYPHNIHFLWAAAIMEGRSEIALTAARKLVSKISEDQVEEYPFVEDFLPTPMFTLARFGRWDQILGEPRPASKHKYTTAIWHYVRGLAYARKAELERASAEHAQLRAIAEQDAMRELEFFGGTAQKNLRIASHHLAGEIAAHRGNFDSAADELGAAVRLQDSLDYTEPPPWYFPVRQALGAVLLDAGRVGEAEQVYRTDLKQNPRNGWSLFGMAESLRRQGRRDEAAFVERGFSEAWARADVALRGSRF
jgi:tetratricopeptide (TPR) repeat protein